MALCSTPGCHNNADLDSNLCSSCSFDGKGVEYMSDAPSIEVPLPNQPEDYEPSTDESEDHSR